MTRRNKGERLAQINKRIKFVKTRLAGRSAKQVVVSIAKDYPVEWNGVPIEKMPVLKKVDPSMAEAMVDAVVDAQELKAGLPSDAWSNMEQLEEGEMAIMSYDAYGPKRSQDGQYVTNSVVDGHFVTVTRVPLDDAGAQNVKYLFVDQTRTFEVSGSSSQEVFENFKKQETEFFKEKWFPNLDNLINFDFIKF